MGYELAVAVLLLCWVLPAALFFRLQAPVEYELHKYQADFLTSFAATSLGKECS